jgi:hypothetical protein
MVRRYIQGAVRSRRIARQIRAVGLKSGGIWRFGTTLTPVMLAVRSEYHCGNGGRFRSCGVDRVRRCNGYLE